MSDTLFDKLGGETAVNAVVICETTRNDVLGR